MRRRTLIVIAVALLATSPAYANVAAPFAAFAWPISLLILLPVIAIEAWVAVSVLRVSLDRGLKIATQANLYSTGIGLIATAPAALFVPDMAVLGVLGPLGFSHEPSRRLWLALAAGLLVAAPSYLVSVWLEERVVRRLLDPERAPRARRWAWTANGWSYLLIWALYACYFQYASESWYRMSQKVRQTICLSNLKWIARATLGHRTDPPGAVPQVVDFAVLTRLVAAERKRGHDVLHCPDSKRGYLFNTGLSGVPIAAIRERSQTVMIRDAVPHGDGLLCVVFADGTARAIPPPTSERRGAGFGRDRPPVPPHACTRSRSLRSPGLLVKLGRRRSGAVSWRWRRTSGLAASSTRLTFSDTSSEQPKSAEQTCATLVSDRPPGLLQGRQTRLARRFGWTLRLRALVRRLLARGDGALPSY